jgi:hypothetical protein
MTEIRIDKFKKEDGKEAKNE